MIPWIVAGAVGVVVYWKRAPIKAWIAKRYLQQEALLGKPALPTSEPPTPSGPPPASAAVDGTADGSVYYLGYTWDGTAWHGIVSGWYPAPNQAQLPAPISAACQAGTITFWFVWGATWTKHMCNWTEA